MWRGLARFQRVLMWRASQATRLRRVRIWAFMVVCMVALLAVDAAFSDSRPLAGMLGDITGTVAIALFLGALCCEYIDSSLGMGYGTTLTPLLLLVGFEPLQIVPAVLLSEFCTGLAAALLHQRDGNIDFLRDKHARRTAGLLSVLSVVGATAAVTVALSISKFWLTAIIAIIVLSMGFVVVVTSRRQLQYRPVHLIVLGAVAAFNKGMSGGGYGPLVTGGQVVSGINSKQAVAITSLAESLTCLVGLIAYFAMAAAMDWSLALPLTAGALMSVPIATLTVRKLPEQALRGGIGVATCALGALMIAKLLL